MQFLAALTSSGRSMCSPQEKILNCIEDIRTDSRGVSQSLKNLTDTARETEERFDESFMDKLGDALENLRLKNPSSYTNVVHQANKARISLSQKLLVSSITPIITDYSFVSDEVWSPRAVEIHSDINYEYRLGSSLVYDLSSSNGSNSGFTIECWIKIPKNPKSNFIIIQNEDISQNDIFLSLFISNFKLTCIYNGVIVECLKTLKPNEWLHVSLIINYSRLFLVVNGRETNQSSISFLRKHCVYVLGRGVGTLCEFRVWNIERDIEEVRLTMASSIPPSCADQFPGLRLLWLPCSMLGTVYSPGSLLYDTWTRKPVGSRLVTSNVADSRWPCALPPGIRQPPSAPWSWSVETERQECREKYELHQVTKMPKHISSLERNGLQISCRQSVLDLLSEGGLWLPRCVRFPADGSSSVTVSTTQDLGILSQIPSSTFTNNSTLTTSRVTFTIEAWIRLSKDAEKEVLNTIVSWGARPLSPAELQASSGTSGGSHKAICPSFLFGVQKGLLFVEYESVKVIAREALPPALSWVHVATVCDETTLRLVINGRTVASCPWRVTSTSSANNIIPSAPVQIGSFHKEFSLGGDMCEFRLWTVALPDGLILERMSHAIPVIAMNTSQFSGLRLGWCPLRAGGPASEERHVRWKGIRSTRETKKIALTSPKSISTVRSGSSEAMGSLFNDNSSHWKSTDSTPCASILWDVEHQCDVGYLDLGIHLPASRIRLPAVTALTPHDSYFPRKWDSQTIAVLDEWSDEYDRAFIPNELLSRATDSLSLPPLPPGPEPWLPRAVKFPVKGFASAKLGSIAQLGIASSFTLECWVYYVPRSTVKTKTRAGEPEIQDLIGHEDPQVCKKKGLFSAFSKSEGLFIGLFDGRPYVACHGKVASIKDVTMIANKSLKIKIWTHIAIVYDNGKWTLFADGEEENTTPSVAYEVVTAPHEAMMHAFGWVDGAEMHSVLTEMRLWTCPRTQHEVRCTMNTSICVNGDGTSPFKSLKLVWLPLKSTQTLFYDCIDYQPRGICRAVHMSRRPFILPIKIIESVTRIPSATIIDDIGDAYEMNTIPIVTSNIKNYIKMTNGHIRASGGSSSNNSNNNNRSDNTVSSPSFHRNESEDANSFYFDANPSTDDWDFSSIGKYSVESGLE